MSLICKTGGRQFVSTRTLFLHFEPLLLSVSKHETNAPSRESSLQSMKIPDNNNLANEREESSSFDHCHLIHQSFWSMLVLATMYHHQFSLQAETLKPIFHGWRAPYGGLPECLVKTWPMIFGQEWRIPRHHTEGRRVGKHGNGVEAEAQRVWQLSQGQHRAARRENTEATHCMAAPDVPPTYYCDACMSAFPRYNVLPVIPGGWWGQLVMPEDGGSWELSRWARKWVRMGAGGHILVKWATSVLLVVFLLLPASKAGRHQVRQPWQERRYWHFSQGPRVRVGLRYEAVSCFHFLIIHHCKQCTMQRILKNIAMDGTIFCLL